MASPEIQQGGKTEKIWRFLAVGIAAAVILAVAINAIDLKIAQIQNG